jgi:hypothetical protein
MREQKLGIGYLKSVLKSVHDRPLATSLIGAYPIHGRDKSRRVNRRPMTPSNPYRILV